MRLFKCFSILIVIAILLAWPVNFRVASYADTQVFGSPRFTSLHLSDQEQTTIHVPGEIASLQDAIGQVADGGIIELASGTYAAPANGFLIHDLGKGFTIRAADGTTVILSGGGSSPILRFQNSSRSQGGPVTFEGLTFANGYSTTEGLAGGVTIYEGAATFVNCTFTNNVGAVNTTVGGAVYVAEHSSVFFFDTTWVDNVSRVGGAGLGIRSQSKVYVHNAQFLNNSANPAYHVPTASGGGISLGNSLLRISDSYFENNQAGGFGGAVYAIGNWAEPYSTPQADVLVTHSSFINNQAARHPTVSYSLPTEGGAINAEDQTVFKIYNSRFTTNSAMIGGGVNSYRAIVEIYGSVFQGNRATDTQFQSGFGGSISLNSSDGPVDGWNNRPASRLTVENTLLQGRYASVTTVAQTGGCIFAGGDGSRIDGNSDVPDMGSVADNRAQITLRRVSLYDCDVTATPPNSGVGGAIEIAIANLTIEDSLIAKSDAFGTYGSGGGLAILYNSLANIQTTMIAGNSADQFGGGIFTQGSTINLSECSLIENKVNNSNYGSAIFNGPDDGRGLPVNGTIQSCTISNNYGLPIYDDDRAYGPINDVRYNGNQIFHGSAGSEAYSDSLPGYTWKTVQELNDLVIARANGTSTDKSQLANTSLNSPAISGALLAAPSTILPANSPVYLAYAWSGGNATLDGAAVSGNAGLSSTTDAGNHALAVTNRSFSDAVLEAPSTEVIFSSSSQGSNLTLFWSVLEGSYQDAAIDQGVSIAPAPSGSVQVSADPPRNYRFYAITEEGGVVASINTDTPLLYAPSEWPVLTGLNLPTHNGYLPIYNLGGSAMNWTAQTSTPDLIRIVTSSGQTETSGTIVFTINVDGRAAGTYTGTIDIDAGDAGSKKVTILVYIFDVLHQSFLPISNR